MLVAPVDDDEEEEESEEEEETEEEVSTEHTLMATVPQRLDNFCNEYLFLVIVKLSSFMVRKVALKSVALT